MKRLNPNTRQPFKHGDVREDGYIFWSYNTTIKKDGTKAEKWLSPAKWDESKTKQKDRIRKSNKGKVLINPLTLSPYKRGDKTEVGLFFWESDGYGSLDKQGFKRPVFITKKEFDRRVKQKAKTNFKNRKSHMKDFHYFIKDRLTKAKQRAKRKNLKFLISEDYLKAIYPSDGLCPVFKVKMEFFGDGLNSASLDRVDNEKGYEEGNVRWMCMRANRVKGTATNEEILALADFIRG